MKVELAVDVLAFRRTMGLFATGVTVLTTTTDSGEVIGMTANAITSVSLEPMLILVCVGKQANIMPHILNEPDFTLSFLRADQVALSVYFAGLWKEAVMPTFEFTTWEGGVPRLATCLAAVGCRRVEALEGGDHWIVLGEVTALYRSEDTSDPLLFYGGQYRRLAALDDERPIGA